MQQEINKDSTVPAAIEGMSMYLQRQLVEYMVIRNGWKEHTPQWETYDLVVRQIAKEIDHLELLERAKQTPNTDTVEQLAIADMPEHVKGDKGHGNNNHQVTWEKAYKAGYLKRDSQGVYTEKDMWQAYAEGSIAKWDKWKEGMVVFAKWLQQYKNTKS